MCPNSFLGVCPAVTEPAWAEHARAERALPVPAEPMVCCLSHCNGRSRSTCHCPQLNSIRYDLLLPVGGLSMAAQIWKAATPCQVARSARGAQFPSDLSTHSLQPPASPTTERCWCVMLNLRPKAHTEVLGHPTAMHHEQTLSSSAPNALIMRLADWLTAISSPNTL